MQAASRSGGRYWRHHHITHSSHTEALVQEILSTEWATQVLGGTERFLKCSLPSSRIKQGLECTSSSSSAPLTIIISPDRETSSESNIVRPGTWIELPIIVSRGSLADGLCSVEAPWYFVFSHWNDIYQAAARCLPWFTATNFCFKQPPPALLFWLLTV